MRIDLNCDLGEGAGHDAELMPLVTSANIACGAHAGDEATMRATVELAQRHGVAIGAHPGFADRAHFGRRELPVTPEEVFQLVRAQTFALRRVAAAAGASVGHVKLHGALYNLAARDPTLAEAAAYAVRDAGPELVWFGLAGSASLAAVRAAGLRVASEVFADRTYQADGSLTPRSRPDALIADADVAVAQVLGMIRERKVRATSGADVTIAADTVCLHGDGAHAVGFARRLRAELAAAGVAVKAFSA
ncbi:LamB/YcsF family protein [Oleiharenicola sp. Vm1]|uniref:LamB/YcsF family protein n=1 Tax=Oleiharenicola sp. Vm1 TaxID=3398393 RepID=UPI0039F61DDD